MTLSIGFHGGAGTVTGSKHLLEVDGKRPLIDCGMFQGLKELRLLNWQPLSFDPQSIDAVVITHAHIDHTGYLPRLVKAGYRGPIYVTPATRELANILLLDAARLQEEDAEYANKKRFTKHRPALPLFTEEDAMQALKQLRPVEHDTWFEAAGIRAQYHNAGHILGSAFVELVAGDQKIVFSGDVGRYNAPLEADPEPRVDCDTLVIESTYGNRVHDPTPLIDQIRAPFRAAVERKGTILIPAFAVARAQIVTLLLSQLIQSGDLPDIPLHVDSPMAVDVTHLYVEHMRDEELRRIPGGAQGLFPRNVTFHRTVDESKQLNNLPGPRVIISSSGMLTGGRVLHHLGRLLPDPANLLVLVGFQAPGTRGRAIQDGAQFVRLHGQDIPVRSPFISVEGMSAHADSEELMRWLHSAKTLPRSVFITHGEPDSADALAGRIGTDGTRTFVPALGDHYSFDGGGWKATRP